MRSANMNGTPNFIVMVAAVYAPMAMNPACPKENIPVKPVSRESPRTVIKFIPDKIKIPDI
jgi:hypothetical protein